MRSLATTFAAALLALLLACTASGQEARPRFLIDSIGVSGLRYASERVIIAETRLQPGREYTEPELRAGAARAARLPFVVRIDLRLDKGETRGAYRLVIDVLEAKPVFAGGTLITGGAENDDEKHGSIGGRLFLGRSGVVHGAATAGDAPAVNLGYTQYDLFGTGVFAAVLLEYRELEYRGGNPPPRSVLETSTQDRITTQLIAGVPIYGNHAIRASWTREPTIVRGLVGPRRPSPFTVEHITTSELTYIYDSTDDPLFPSSGTSVVATAALRRGPFVAMSLRGPELTTYERPSYTLGARRNFDLAPRHSLWAAGTLKHIEREAETFSPIGTRQLTTSTLDRSEIEAGYALTLRPNALGDVRIETGVGYGTVRQVRPLPTGRIERISDTTPNAYLGVVFRNPWAVFRLRFEVGK